jgi:hypothetical protein
MVTSFSGGTKATAGVLDDDDDDELPFAAADAT